MNGYSDNLKYIAEKIHELNKPYEMIWIVSDMNQQFPSYITPVKLRSIKSCYYLATAKIWIDSQRKRFFMSKRRKQYYIQTWHGCLGFKKIEMDAVDSYSNKFAYKIERAVDSKMIDLFISGADWFSEIVRRAFIYKGPILATGLPRNDVFINSENKVYKEFREKYGFSENQKLIIYAPTFRKDESSICALNLDYEKLVKELNKNGQNYKLITRLHPRNKKCAMEIKYSDSVINGSFYPDMQELLLASDMLITDYSSCIFDFALMKKPAFVYASDIEEYKNDRDFYLDIESLPFKVATDLEKLIENIQLFNNELYQQELSKFFCFVGLKETGHAAENVVNVIDTIMSNKSKKDIESLITKLNTESC